MLSSLKKVLSKALGGRQDRRVQIRWVTRRSSSWLAEHVTSATVSPGQSRFSTEIERLANETNGAGAQPLWEGYADSNVGGETRKPEAVRTAVLMGEMYSWLVQRWKPEIVVEFGTAFGVSGMYFLAGLEINGRGRLLTFEPNEVWRPMAVRCLSAISGRYTSVSGTFEENVDKILANGERIDLAFIDAIHTSAFVRPQLEIVVARCSDRALIILDDINFSDDMRKCWHEVSRQDRFVSSLELGGRVGVLEFARGAAGSHGPTA